MSIAANTQISQTASPLLACAYGEVARLEKDWHKAKGLGQQPGNLKITMDWYKPSEATVAAHVGTSTKAKARSKYQTLARATTHTTAEHAEGATTSTTIPVSRVVRNSFCDHHHQQDHRRKTRRREPARTTVRVTVRQEPRAENDRIRRNSAGRKSAPAIVPMAAVAAKPRHTPVQYMKPSTTSNQRAPAVSNSKRRRARTPYQPHLPSPKAAILPASWYPSYHPSAAADSQHRTVEQPPIFRTVHWGAPRRRPGPSATLSSRNKDESQRNLHQGSRSKRDKPTSDEKRQTTSISVETKNQSLAVVSDNTKQMSPLLSTSDSPTTTQSDISVPAKKENLALTLALRPPRPRSPSQPRPRKKSIVARTSTRDQRTHQHVHQAEPVGTMAPPRRPSHSYGATHATSPDQRPTRQRQKMQHVGLAREAVEIRITDAPSQAHKKRQRQQTDSEADTNMGLVNPGTIIKKVRYEVDSSGRLKQMPGAGVSSATETGTATGHTSTRREGEQHTSTPGLKVTRYRYRVV
jgi:hypothetical protein